MPQEKRHKPGLGIADGKKLARSCIWNWEGNTEKVTHMPRRGRGPCESQKEECDEQRKRSNFQNFWSAQLRVGIQITANSHRQCG